MKKFLPLFKVAGIGIQLVCIYFIASLFFSHIEEIQGHFVHAGSMLTSLVLPLFLSLIASLHLILASYLILKKLLSNQISPITVFYIHGRSAIGKYLPGNFFHYVGRQIFAKHLGIRQAEIAFSSVLEAVLLVVACCTVFVVFGCITSFQWLSQAFSKRIFALILIPILVFLLIYVVRKNRTVDLLHRISLSTLFSSYFACILFVIVGGASMVFLVSFYTDSMSLSLILKIISIYSLSYVAGFVTPGAPAGIGIREALLMYLLSGIVQQSVIFSVCIVHRLLFVGTDLLYYVITQCFTPKFINSMKLNLSDNCSKPSRI